MSIKLVTCRICNADVIESNALDRSSITSKKSRKIYECKECIAKKCDKSIKEIKIDLWRSLDTKLRIEREEKIRKINDDILLGLIK